MTPPSGNPRRGLWQWALILSGSSLLAALVGFDLWGLIVRSPSETGAYSNEQTNPSSKKLLGTWQFEDKFRMIFTPEGKLLVQSDDGGIKTFQYRLETTPQSDRIDIFQDGSTFSGIFKFDNDGKLHLATNKPGEPRPTSFEDAHFILEKISDRTTLSPDSQLSKQELRQRTNKAIQSEAITYVSTLNKGQQAIFTEKGYFSSSIESLGVGIKPETDNYSYRVRVVDRKRAQTMGIAKKDGLKSYTGAVFILIARSTTDIVSLSILCESDRPTKSIPSIPTASSEYSDAQLSCPTGYKEFREPYNAKTSVNRLNRGQQGLFIEKSRFSSNIEDLGVGVQTETDDFFYRVRVFDNKRVQTMGIPKKDGLNSYTGGVFVLRDRYHSQNVSPLAILCESDRPTKAIPPIPTASSEFSDAQLKCPPGYTQVGR